MVDGRVPKRQIRKLEEFRDAWVASYYHATKKSSARPSHCPEMAMVEIDESGFHGCFSELTVRRSFPWPGRASAVSGSGFGSSRMCTCCSPQRKNSPGNGSFSGRNFLVGERMFGWLVGWLVVEMSR